MQLPTVAQTSAIALSLLSFGTAAAARDTVRGRLVDLPLAFEENRGQLPDEVRFRAQGDGFRLHLDVSGGNVLEPSHDGRASGLPHVRLRWLGASLAPRIAAEKELPGRLHYYTGSDPDAWHTGVRTYGRVRYADLYPGIDLVYHDRASRIEFDFEVAAGADPGVIAMAFEADEVAIAPDGSLRLRARDYEIRFDTPELFQEYGGDREPVAGAYRIDEDGSVGFAVGPYDTSRPLVIDPVVLGLASRLGGSAFDEPQDIDVDGDGFVYVTGGTTSTDFLGATGPPTGGQDVFVAKVRVDGMALVYAAILGGSGFDLGIGVAANGSGEAFVSGHTESANFPTLGAFDGTLGGMSDAFLAHLDSTGTLLYSTYYGGSDFDGRFDGGVAVHSSGRVYLASRTDSTADLPTLNAYEASCAVGPCAMVAGFDTSETGANSHVYGSFIGGNGSEGALAIDVDASENLYVFGFTGSDLDLVDATQAFQASTGDVLNRDHFLIKLDPSLVGAAQRVYSTYIGGLGDEPEGGDITANDAGTVWVVSETDSDAPQFPVKNALQANNAGVEDGYVIKIDTTTTGAASEVWGTFLGGSGTDRGEGVAVDSANTVYVGLQSRSSDFPLLATLPQFDPPSGSNTTGVLAQLSADGQTLLLSTPLTGAKRLAPDTSDRIHAVGQKNDAVFPLKDGLPPSPIGGLEIFLARLDPIADTGLTLVADDNFDPVAAGDTFAYRYLITNNGDEVATDMTLSATFPGGLTLVGTSANCTFPGATSDCDFFEDLGTGENEPVYLLASSVSTGSFSSTGTVASVQVDPVPADNSDTEMITVDLIGSPPASLTLSDFDAVANAQDIGEFSLDTRDGVLATANGSFDGAVNFMVFDGSIPLHVIEMLGQGVVAFGVVERNNWTPSDGDGEDLFGLQFNASADRVFGTVDAFGHVELWSAAPFDPGLLVAEGSVDLDPTRAFSLVVDIGGSNAQVIYDGFVVAQGDPFTVSSSDADPAQIGDDQVITVSFGTEFRGSATINDVPEPGGTLMLMVGIAALASLRGRQIRL